MGTRFQAELFAAEARQCSSEQLLLGLLPLARWCMKTTNSGQMRAGGDGSGEQGASGKGMWLALSQVQEWVVEFSCDMLFISIRTDVAWYRLSRCAPSDGCVTSVQTSMLDDLMPHAWLLAKHSAPAILKYHAASCSMENRFLELFKIGLW